MYQTRRVVFARHPAWPELSRYARGYGWQLIQETAAGAVRNAPKELVLKAGSTSLEVHYCEDEITQNSYVFAVGATKNVAESLIKMIERDLGTWSLQALLDMFDRSSGFNDKGSALIKLTLSGPNQVDQRVYERVRVCLNDPDERLRDLAIWATGYTPWPEYKDLLRVAMAEDSSERIRGRAARMLEAFDAAEDP
jgi:hypothetical protein